MKKGSLKNVAAGGPPGHSAGSGINKYVPDPKKHAKGNTGGAGGGKYK